MSLKFLCLVICLPVFLACNIQFDLPKSAPAPKKEEPTVEVSTSWESELLDLVNEIRKDGCRCGNKRMKPVPPLELNTTLNKAAQIHADDMHRNRFFDHMGSDGSRIGDRATKVGFYWRNIGENISEGYPTVKSAFEGWKSSPGHCQNMMGYDFRYMGAAQKGRYWVQTFGTPR